MAQIVDLLAADCQVEPGRGGLCQLLQFRRAMVELSDMMGAMVQCVPFVLAPILISNAMRFLHYCSDRSRQSRKKPSQKVPDANIRQRVQCFLDEKLCTTSRMLVDFVSLSNASFLFLVWVKVNQLGIDGVPPYDIAVVPIAFFNVGLSALFQADYFPNERRSVEVYALLWNLMLVLVKVFADRCNITDRDDTILAYRLCAGFSFGDHRKAAAMQVLWGVLQAYKPHIGTMAWDAIVWELQRQMFTIGHMWLLWYGAEYAVTQLSQLIIQNADVNASLEAARAVLASQCDAEAYLSEDLAFQNPSAKLAHILGVGEPQLQQKCILDLLSDADQERFKKFVEASVYNMNNGQRTAAGLTVTLQHPKGPRDVQIYLGSIPAQFGSDRPSHLIALNEVRDLSACEPTEEETPPQQQLQQQPPVSPHAGQSEDTGGMRLNADALAYHTGCHTRSWAYDGGGSHQMANFQDVSVSLNSNFEVTGFSTTFNRRCKSRGAVSLKECIVHGAWEDFRNWVTATAKGNDAPTMPSIVPFMFPKIVSAVLAARCVELHRSRESGGLVLRL
ncbi:unnamed protein product, partial [Effrenium voratum]